MFSDKKKKPIAITIGTDDEGRILARADKEAEKLGVVQLLDFVRVGDMIGRIVRLEDRHDYPRDSEIFLIAKQCLSASQEPEEEVKGMIYKRLLIEPMGVVNGNGELSEYQGSIGFFQPVYRASEEHITRLYPSRNGKGLVIGKITSGYKVSGVDFQLGVEAALKRHIAVFGKNGTGKTNFLKELIAANLEQEKPIPMLVFGHPDIGMDNPNDNGTKGVLSLGDNRISAFGYSKQIRLSPEELSLSDIFEQFETSTSMRDLWAHMQARDPKRFIEILAGYDINEDPLNLRRETVKDSQTKETRTVGIAHSMTIDAVCKQARILSRYVDAQAPPVVAQIMAQIKQGNTVLVNTFSMSEYYQGLFIRLLLNRLLKAGKAAMHKKISQRFLVVIDEAQHFIRMAGESIAQFVMECRKFGITLLLSTQSPKSVPESVYGQIYSTVSFHLNKADLKCLVDNAPMLEECKAMIAYPPLKNTLGLAIIQAVGYPYPAVVKIPLFERRLKGKSNKKKPAF